MQLANTPPRRGAVTVDAALVARAEAAIIRLSSQFGGWMREEVERLEVASALVRHRGFGGALGEHFNNQAHEVKGLAATCGYPVITQLAGSLCRLIENPDVRSSAPMGLVDAHIAAIGAAVRDNVRHVDHPAARALVGELDARVRARLQA